MTRQTDEYVNFFDEITQVMSEDNINQTPQDIQEIIAENKHQVHDKLDDMYSTYNEKKLYLEQLEQDLVNRERKIQDATVKMNTDHQNVMRMKKDMDVEQSVVLEQLKQHQSIMEQNQQTIRSIQSQHEQIDQLESLLVSRDLQLEQHMRELHDKHEQINTRENELISLHEQLDTKFTTVTEREEQLKKQQAKLRKMQQQLTREREQYIQDAVNQRQ